jgi:Tol biopolymer transport system component
MMLGKRQKFPCGGASGVPLPLLWLLAPALLLAAGIAAAPALASPAVYGGISADGRVAVFSTTESLVPGDTDGEVDVYERSKDESLGGQYVTRQVSLGPQGGNDAQRAQFDAVSADGTKAFFSTKERMVSADTDKREDIYVRDLETNSISWVSQGASSCTPNGCGNAGLDSSFAPGGLSSDGNRVFFVTEERLAPQDTDTAPDIYMRDLSTGTTTLVSQGAASCVASGCGNGELGVVLDGISSNGDVAVFSTQEALSGEDSDTQQDIYARDLATETTSLVSTPGTCPTGLDCSAAYGGMASDGGHVFFETREQVSGADGDEFQDVYDWSGGTASLASIGSAGGNGEHNATFAGNSADGSAVYFATDEQLEPTDTDTVRDVYERSGGETALVSISGEGGNGAFPAQLVWVSPDGSSSAVAFTTEESLTSSDTDEAQDVYLRSGSTTTLVSTGPEDENAADSFFAGASHDGSRVFFVTTEALVPEDTDTNSDIYERSGEATTLISTGPEGGNGPFGSGLNGVSDDGEYAFFTTEEHLTEGDVDAEVDIYDQSPGGTFLVSTGNGAAVGPRTPELTGTNPSSPNASTTPLIVGGADPETSIKIYATFDCSQEPVATGTVEELQSPGIQVTVAPGTTASFRATAEADGLVSSCSAPVTYKQEESAPPPPPPTEEGGAGGGGTGGGTGGGGSGGGKGGGGSKGKGGGGITYVTPETVITFGPSFKTRKHRPVFRFDDSTGQPGSRFVCRIDRHRWRSCDSPRKLRRLRPGRHTFRVRAINALGVSDPHPDRRTFKVVR